jgi:hypothetical protein
MASQNSFGIVSYNLYGLNNGRSQLAELCDNPDVAVIAIPEHWLTPDKLYLLNCIHPEFVGLGVLAMCRKLS